MASDRIRWLRLRNWLHGLTLLASMAGLFAVIGHLIGGPLFALAGIVLIGVLLLSPQLVPVELVLRMHRARPLAAHEAPILHEAVATLARRAGLPAPPTLYLLPTGVANAFAIGDRRHGAIAVSLGLLQELSDEEVCGVLAHELAHLAHADTRWMALAAVMNRLATGGANLLLWIMLLNLPLILAGHIKAPLLILVLLVSMPVLQGLLQLAFSRSREFAADLAAATLLGDPAPLARALARLEQHRQRSRWPWQPRPLPEQETGTSGWLRSHPATAERIRRLLDLQQGPHSSTGRSGVYPGRACVSEDNSVRVERNRAPAVLGPGGR